MWLFVLIAFLVLILTLILHFYQHFECICNCGSVKTKVHHERTHAQYSVRNIERHIQRNLRRTNRTKCCYSIEPLDEFDFFPMSFLWYLTFMIILCLLISTTEVLKYFIYSKSTGFIDVSFAEIHKLNTIHILDYIIIYGILILCIWASLFSFYRYLSTLNSAAKLQSLSGKKLFKKFAIYAVIFCIVFAVQIHLFYWIFPALVAMFCGFNFYCTIKFASILVKQFQQFKNVRNNRFNFNSDFQKEMDHMLFSALFTKYMSLICCGLQSIQLGLFAITYNIAVIHYLTILWSISGFIFSLTFIRNRMFLKQNIIKLTNMLNCKTYTSQKENVSIKNSTSKAELIDNNFESTPHIITQETLAIQPVTDCNAMTYRKSKSFTPNQFGANKIKFTTSSNPCTPDTSSKEYSNDESGDNSSPTPIKPQFKNTVSLNIFSKVPAKPQLKLSYSNPMIIPSKTLTEEIKDDNKIENYKRIHSGSIVKVSTNTLSVNTGYRNTECEQQMFNFSPLVLKHNETMIENTNRTTPIILEGKEHDYEEVALEISKQMSCDLSPELEKILNTFGSLTRCGFVSPTNVNTFNFSAV